MQGADLPLAACPGSGSGRAAGIAADAPRSHSLVASRLRCARYARLSASTRGRLAPSSWVRRLPLWSPASRAPTSARPPQVGALPSGGGGIPPAVVPPSPAPPASLPPSPAGGRITLNILRFSAIPHPSSPRIALNQYLVQFAVAGGASPPCLRGWWVPLLARRPPPCCPSDVRCAQSAPPRPCAFALSLARAASLPLGAARSSSPVVPGIPPLPECYLVAQQGEFVKGKPRHSPRCLRHP